jgi:hypothetical protein
MKKAQITLFIIVGIVVLLVIGLGVTIYKSVASEAPPEDELDEQTSLEVEPLRELINTCLESTTRLTFEQIGLNAGYYSPQQSGYIAIPEQPTTGRAFQPFTGQVLPYWSHISSPDDCLNCEFATEQPALLKPSPRSVQAQAEKAIEEQFSSCLNNFASLDGVLTVTPQADPVIAVDFGENDVYVTATYPLTVQTRVANKQIALRTFRSSVDIPFKKLYDYAEQVRTSNDLSHYFEGLTLETIVLESAGDPEPIPPPFGQTVLTYDPSPIWTLHETKELVAAALERNIMNVQLLGSRDMDIVATGDPLTDNQYANYYFSIADPADDVRARFLYLSDWTPYVAIHPGGQLIRPDMITLGLPLMPSMKRKDFQYDVSYPILVQLEAETKYGPYVFQFPIEVNMRNNNPLDYEPIEVQEASVSLCDPAVATGSVAHIRVADQVGTPTNAVVRYSCGGTTCTYGNTVNGRMDVQLPVCLGGELTAEKENYNRATSRFDSFSGEQTVALQVTSYTPVQVTPELFFIEKDIEYVNGMPIPGHKLSLNAFTVDVPYELTVVLTPVDNPSASQVLHYPADEAQTAQLYPGTYDVTAVLMKQLDTPVIIQGGERCYGGVVGIGEECTTIPDITFGEPIEYTDELGETQQADTSLMYVGGLQWDAGTKQLVITQESIADRKLTLPVISIDLTQMTEIEDLGMLDLIDDFSVEVSEK